MWGLVWRGSAAILLSCVLVGDAYGQVLRMGAVGASSGVAVGKKFGMRSLAGQAASGIPVSDNYRYGVGLWFADTQIKIPDAVEETETLPGDLPAKFELRQNYPNPFNPSTTIEYDTPTTAHVRIEVFSILGRRMAVLVNEQQPAGKHKLIWNAADDTGASVASGVYLYRIVAGRFTKTRTMTLVK